MCDIIFDIKPLTHQEEVTRYLVYVADLVKNSVYTESGCSGKKQEVVNAVSDLVTLKFEIEHGLNPDLARYKNRAVIQELRIWNGWY